MQVGETLAQTRLASGIIKLTPQGVRQRLGCGRVLQ